ncbi:hypothetical protein NDU88_001773 [Pleurodeles waltl]|uniref:Uncharacterized protein n=1 Tax=Pleurodeles waltl TaxID=8319 RepID=A0AAV7P7T6_PLEWA|nr:hypothetical protein NDU88_001773 [Pleurodeles waltl]
MTVSLHNGNLSSSNIVMHSGNSIAAGPSTAEEYAISLFTLCDGPLQQQAGPSGCDDPASAATSNPEVQRLSTNPHPHPGHIEQSENFRAMPRLHKRDSLEKRGRTCGIEGAGDYRWRKKKTRKTALQGGPKT